MSSIVLASGGCSECGARWSWAGRQWLVADQHGRTSYRSGTLVDGKPEPLQQCPECGARLLPGKAKVEEVMP